MDERGEYDRAPTAEAAPLPGGRRAILIVLIAALAASAVALTPAFGALVRGWVFTQVRFEGDGDPLSERNQIRLFKTSRGVFAGEKGGLWKFQAGVFQKVDLAKDGASADLLRDLPDQLVVEGHAAGPDGGRLIRTLAPVEDTPVDRVGEDQQFHGIFLWNDLHQALVSVKGKQSTGGSSRELKLLAEKAELPADFPSEPAWVKELLASGVERKARQLFSSTDCTGAMPKIPLPPTQPGPETLGKLPVELIPGAAAVPLEEWLCPAATSGLTSLEGVAKRGGDIFLWGYGRLASRSLASILVFRHDDVAPADALWCHNNEAVSGDTVRVLVIGEKAIALTSNGIGIDDPEARCFSHVTFRGSSVEALVALKDESSSDRAILLTSKYLLDFDLASASLEYLDGASELRGFSSESFLPLPGPPFFVVDSGNLIRFDTSENRKGPEIITCALSWRPDETGASTVPPESLTESLQRPGRLAETKFGVFALLESRLHRLDLEAGACPGDVVDDQIFGFVESVLPGAGDFTGPSGSANVEGPFVVTERQHVYVATDDWQAMLTAGIDPRDPYAKMARYGSGAVFAASAGSLILAVLYGLLYRARFLWGRGAYVFISYRRADTQVEAELLYERLLPRLAPLSVFLDRSDLEGGSKWEAEIDAALASAKVLLVLIGENWLTSAKDGEPRLFQERDVLRSEIEAALGRDDIRVIPVLVGNAKLPGRDQLPSSISALASREVVRLGGVGAKVEQLRSQTNAIAAQIWRHSGLAWWPRSLL